MSLRPSFKLSLPIAALALLVAFAAWPGVRPQTAEATVSNVTSNVTIGGDGQNVTITVTGLDDAGTMTLDNNSDELFTWAAGACDDAGGNGGCDTELSASGAATLTLDTDTLDTSYTLTVTMQLNCSGVEAVRVTADDTDNSDFVDVFCAPDDNDPQVIIRKDSDFGSNFDFSWDANGGDCVVDAEGEIDLDDGGSFDLDDGDQAEFFCEDAVTLVVGEQDDGAFQGISGCTEASEGVDDITGDSVTFDISDLEAGDTVICTWVNDEDILFPTAVAGPVTSVQVVAAPTITCGGTTAIQVTLRNASGGPAPAGTSVTASSSLGGTFQPATTLTGSFAFSFATFLYQAPPTGSGITTITVRTSNNVAGVANIQIICGTAPTPVATPGPLKPPSAGDGGLLAGSSGSGFDLYLPSALAASVAVLVMGVTVAARRRAAFAPAVSVSAPARPVQAGSSGGGGFAMLLSLALIGVALFFKRRP